MPRVYGGVEDNTVDVCFTSPPYNIKSSGENDKCGKAKYKIDEYRDDWYEWQIKCIDEMLRISKRIVIYNIQAGQYNKRDVYKIIGHYADRIHDIAIWYKPNGQPQSKPYRISNTYEFILIIKKNPNYVLELNERFARNVIEHNVNTNPYSDIHGAVMPLDFARLLIHRYTFENEVIFDPFMGLGTTALACDSLKRHFIGTEKEQRFFDIANERLRVQQQQISIFDVM